MEEKTPCRSCGEPATVHIRNGFGEQSVVQDYCLACAEAQDRAAAARIRRLNTTTVCIAVGLLAGFISLFADQLAFGSADGFGWQQWGGVVVSTILVIVGGLIRAPTLLAIGLVALAITLAADRIGFGNADGFGWQQICGLGLGVLLIGGGAIGRVWSRPARFPA